MIRSLIIWGFSLNLGIWEISHKSRHLENFSDSQVFGKFQKFPKFLQKFEAGICLIFWKFLKRYLGVYQKLRHLGYFPDSQAFGKNPRYPGIWEISKIFQIHHFQIPTGIQGDLRSSQIPRILGIFPDTQAFRKFPRYQIFGKFVKTFK